MIMTFKTVTAELWATTRSELRICTGVGIAGSREMEYPFWVSAHLTRSMILLCLAVQDAWVLGHKCKMCHKDSVLPQQLHLVEAWGRLQDPLIAVPIRCCQSGLLGCLALMSGTMCSRRGIPKPPSTTGAWKEGSGFPSEVYTRTVWQMSQSHATVLDTWTMLEQGVVDTDILAKDGMRQ